MKIVKTGLIVFIVLCVAGVAIAVETTNITPQAGSKGITSTAAKDKGPGLKAERGVKNILFGWTDIPRSIIQVTSETKNPFWGLTAGTLKGIGKAFPRTVSGVADVVSFPMGDYNKLPIRPDPLDSQVK